MEQKMLPLRKRAEFLAVQKGEKRRGALFLLEVRQRAAKAEAGRAAAMRNAPQAGAGAGNAPQAGAESGAGAVSACAAELPQAAAAAGSSAAKMPLGSAARAEKKPALSAAKAALLPRIGFTVTRKNGNAVRRNRIKRRLREAARLSGISLCAAVATDYVFVARPEILDAPFSRLMEEMRRRVSGSPARRETRAKSDEKTGAQAKAPVKAPAKAKAPRGQRH